MARTTKFCSKIMIPFSSLISQDMTPHFLIKFFYIFQVTKTKHMILNSWMQFIQISVIVKASLFFGLNHTKTVTVQNASIYAHSCLECWLVLISLALLEYFSKVLTRLILWPLGNHISLELFKCSKWRKQISWRLKKSFD